MQVYTQKYFKSLACVYYLTAVALNHAITGLNPVGVFWGKPPPPPPPKNVCGLALRIGLSTKALINFGTDLEAF